MPSDFSLSSTCIVIWQERIETGETSKPTFVYLGVCMFVYLGVSRFLYRWSFSVNVQLSAGCCKILAGIVGARLSTIVNLLFRHFFHLYFCRFVFLCAVLCREGGALAAPGDILAGICLPLGEKYPNTANNLIEM